MNPWHVLVLAVAVWFLLVVALEAHKMRHDDDE